MKNNWKGNQRYKEDISQATILTLNSPFKISIHKYSGCGNKLYLTCATIDADCVNLHTEDWNEAEEKAISIVKDEISKLYNSLSEIN
ncbi:MAG TPA: hypothetical protein DC000_05110 [Clostridiales bacterium]|nr:hypothetical protein [Clostridiales bacterium]